MSTPTRDRSAAAAIVDAQVALRVDAGARFPGPDAARLARLCHRLAERFARGGRLIAVASAPAARSDARHIAVEFVHPVIVGKRALPALALTGTAGELRARVRALTREPDIVVAFGTDADGGAAAGALAAARARGCLTVAFENGAGAEWELAARAADPKIRQELVETAYHLLWELVHVFFEHRGLLGGREQRSGHDAGAASFLYPFLADAEHDLNAVIDDVRRSVLMKAAEIAALRTLTLTANADVLTAAAAAVRASFDAGGTLLALGNGGSATDAMDLAADLAGRAVIDLTEDPSILTAVANDIGAEAIFSRQVIAHGRAGDVLVALSTSGGSANVIDALATARRLRLATVAMVGYDGGRIAAEGLADHVLVTPSQHIPRIQEAQASACHVLCALVEAACA